MPSVRSAALGFWIGVGSRCESHAEAGLSHLIEHLLFKGTERIESVEIDQLFDAMGAELNAGTGKETTSVYTRVLDQHLGRAFEVIADMVWNPVFRDVETERDVVLEEIAMYEDDPQDKVFDLFGEAVFGGAPLGRSIIGRAPVIAETPVEEIAAFHARRYVPGNVVIAAAGSVDHEQIVALAQASEPARAGATSTADPVDPAEIVPRRRFERKDTEQQHLCIGAAGLPRTDERRFALRLLDTILGGQGSSRLFQEVRERRGLAYAVYSFTSHFADTGQIGLYLGTRPDKLAAGAEIVAQELRRLIADGVGDDELRRAKENAEGRIALSLESTAARMNRLGGSLLGGVPLLSIDEVLERVEAVTREDLQALAAELWAPERLSAAGIGPDEAAFRAALEPISAALAEAA